MTADAITAYLTDTCPGVDIVAAGGDRFFIYDPQRNLPPEQRQPFVTIVTSDAHDQASDLGRPGVFRLNIGIGLTSYRARFGEPAKFGEVDTRRDYTTLDTLLPHPVYAAMGWVCVLSPSDETFERLKPLLAEAYRRVAAGKA